MTEKSQSAEGLLAEDHEALDKLLHALLAALGLGDAPTAFLRLDLFWARLAMHIRGEHLHLFPAILRALPSDTGKRGDEIPATAEALGAIAQLHRDHDFFMHQLAGAIKIMRDHQSTGGVGSKSELESVRQMVATVGDRLEAHNKLEEDLVYRLPAKLLEPEEQSALEVEVLGELKNLPLRFRNEASND